MESLPSLNRYGYVAAASTVLAAVLFVLDGGAYQAYAVACLGVAVLTVAVAMGRSEPADDGDADDEQDRREKELKMESGGYGGNAGG